MHATLGNLSKPEMASLFERHGITRLADLTGLDVIGVPVWCCIRPNSRTLATSFGKGLTDEAAQISAIMEALECACAENREALVSVRGTLADVAGGNVESVPLTALDRCNMQQVPASACLDWVQGHSLFTGHQVLAPFELIGMDYERASGPIAAGFQMTSIGLGAGFTREAAVVHAILELVEHEVTDVFEHNPGLLRLFEAKTYAQGTDARLDHAIGFFPPDLTVPVFRAVPNEFGLSVMLCELLDIDASHVVTGGSTVGVACRPSMRDAALAALLEAAQVRATHIAGAREDIRWGHYDTRQKTLAVRLNAEHCKSLSFLQFGDEVTTGQMDLQGLLDLLKESGVKDIWVFDLNQSSEPYFAVRVLARWPGDKTLDVVSLGAGAIGTILGLAKARA